MSKNIFWLTASRALALVLLFLAYQSLFPYLGPFAAGQYLFVLSFVTIFSTVVDFGVQQFFTKQTSEQPENTKKYFHNFLAFEILASVLVYLVLILTASFRHFEPIVFNAVAVAGLGMVANALAYPFLSVMTAKQDLRKVAGLNFLNSMVNVGIIFLAVILKKYIVFLASIQLVFGILALILYRIFIVKHIAKPEVFSVFKDFDWLIIKKILKSAWPFALLVGFSAIYNRVDVIIVTKLLGYIQTGLYTTAYKFFDLLNFFPASVSFVLFPALSALMIQNKITEVRLTLEKYLRLMLFVALPIAAGGTVLSRQLILLLTKNDARYLAAAPVLSILIWAVAILFIYIPVNSLVISQLTKKALLITGANVIVNIVGNILLIPHFGIKAAAVMTVVSEALQGIFYFYFVRNNITEFKFWNLAYKPMLAAMVMGAALWYIRDCGLLVALPAGAGLYLLILIISGFIKKDDVAFVQNLFVKKE